MGTVSQLWIKIKSFLALHREDVFVAAVIILVALLAFGLGRLSVLYDGRGEFKIEYPALGEAAVLSSLPSLHPPSPLQSAAFAGYIASKTGSKYHLPWCAGAQSIKEENKIYFATKEEAEKRGYEPAGNCKGI